MVPDRRIDVPRLYLVLHLTKELIVEGVQPFWPVEGDDSDAASRLCEDQFVSHAVFPTELKMRES